MRQDESDIQRVAPEGKRSQGLTVGSLFFHSSLTAVRTGQAHRTLHGHTGPVTCLQFDETHVVSGSLDKSIRVSSAREASTLSQLCLISLPLLLQIWDLRTGAISDTIRYEYPVTALQFDSRKIMAATGENQLKVSMLYH